METWPLVASSRKSQGGAEEGHGILEGISSLHSWIKSQTMIRPNKIVKKKPEDNYDDVSNTLQKSFHKWWCSVLGEALGSSTKLHHTKMLKNMISSAAIAC